MHLIEHPERFGILKPIVIKDLKRTVKGIVNSEHFHFSYV